MVWYADLVVSLENRWYKSGLGAQKSPPGGDGARTGYVVSLERVEYYAGNKMSWRVRCPNTTTARRGTRAGGKTLTILLC